MPKTTISPDNAFELVLPDGYVLERGEETIIVYSEENGSGTINITNYQIPDDYTFDMKEELRDFASSVDSRVDSQTLEVKSNGYAYSAFIIQGRFWKIWTFFKINQAVFASYNCDVNEKDNEIDKVDMIMRSLRIIH